MVTAAGAVPALALGANGVKAAIGSESIGRVLNYFTGLPSLIGGLLEPYVDGCGEVKSALGER